MDETVRILCVDDERNVLRAIERMFIDEDYEIITASSGEEGLEKLSSSENFHVIISDYRMPGMNGVEFLKKACSLHPETIRIVLSGYADTAAVVAAINEGEIYRFIPKPWNEDELKMTIAKAVEMFALHRENAKLSEELHVKSLALELLSGAVDQQQVLVAGGPHGLDPFIILDSLPFGVLSVLADTVMQMNTAAALLLGRDRDECLSRPMAHVLPADICGFIGRVLAGEKSWTGIAADGRTLQADATALDQGATPAIVIVLTGESSV
ncbi:response regulator, PAS domain-containing [Geotalea daltonii FRC-32]|uniref:Response regulator, PAS domain-containing n=1 Tax=Geotalea daltonii (strain DSM 22248 / JCM 15807 / FRC-32) TaxID=316067 RepID=B9M664_GEODF|nr:response regulator [Geotalea daltonii]ACM21852.1 response regulator, PAS domain-containing [Geotalea daltonii FRC-32]